MALSSSSSSGSGLNLRGDGNLTKLIEHVDDNTTRSTSYRYDWRDRQEYVILPPDGDGRITYTLNRFDNLDRITQVDQYYDLDGDVGSCGWEADDRLLARSQTCYDNRGQAYQSVVRSVDPSNGYALASLVSDTWRDAAGNVIKEQPAGSQAFTKRTFDGLGRATMRYTGYDPAEGASSSSSSSSGEQYAQASSISGDLIFEQVQTDYDAAGNVICTTTWQRMHTADSTTGALGDLATQPKARTTRVGYWYDGIDRPTPTARGYDALARGDWRGALAQFDEVVAREPANADAHRGRGLAYFKMGRLDTAIAEMASVIELRPTDGSAFRDRAVFFLESGDFTRAIADCDAAIRLDKSDALAYSNRGYAHLCDGKTQNAIELADPRQGRLHARRFLSPALVELLRLLQRRHRGQAHGGIVGPAPFAAARRALRCGHNRAVKWPIGILRRIQVRLP